MDTLQEYFKQIRPEPFADLKEAISFINSNQIDPVIMLQQLSLDDFLDFFDEFILIDQVFFQLEVTQVLVSHFKLSQCDFEKQLESDKSLNNETAKNDFLTPDYSAIFTALTALTTSKFTIDGVIDFIQDNFIILSSYSILCMSFYCQFCYNFFVRASKLTNQPQIDLVRQICSKIPITESNSLLLAIALGSQQDRILDLATSTRNWLLSVTAGILQAKQDKVLPENDKFLHEILGQRKRISSGLFRLISELGTDIDAEGSLIVLCEFLILCCKTQKVAEIVGNSSVFLNFLEEKIAENDKYCSVVKVVGRCVIKNAGEFENKAKVMKILSGGVRQGVEVSVDQRM